MQDHMGSARGSPSVLPEALDSYLGGSGSDHRTGLPFLCSSSEDPRA